MAGFAPQERKAVLSLAALYMMRMLGLFMLLPVMSLYARDLEGASDLLIGFAIGAYGITQALLQIPMGTLSDRIGRKPVIIIGQLLFVLGSLIAGMAHHIGWVIVGRLVQGMGAISSTIMAMAADLTAEENRTRTMAMIGASIGVSFAFSLIVGPLLTGPQILFFTAALGVLGIWLVIVVVPDPVQDVAPSHNTLVVPALLGQTARNTQLMRLNFGIFVLHFVLMACFLVVPVILVDQLHLPRAEHGMIYLGLLGSSFVAMFPFMLAAERRGRVKEVMIIAVALLAITLLTMPVAGQHKQAFFIHLFLFFTAFNLLEAMLPSLVSKMAPAGSRGTAMGVYSMAQFLGAFAGGAGGGWLKTHYDIPALFLVSGLLAVAWLVMVATMRRP